MLCFCVEGIVELTAQCTKQFVRCVICAKQEKQDPKVFIFVERHYGNNDFF